MAYVTPQTRLGACKSSARAVPRATPAYEALIRGHVAVMIANLGGAHAQGADGICQEHRCCRTAPLQGAPGSTDDRRVRSARIFHWRLVGDVRTGQDVGPGRQ